MAYVSCSGCKTIVHFSVKDIVEFNNRFVDGKEPIYCIRCFKKGEKIKQVDNKQSV